MAVAPLCPLDTPFCPTVSGIKEIPVLGEGTLFADFKAKSSSTILVVNSRGELTEKIIFVFVLKSGLASWRPLTKSREERNWADSLRNCAASWFLLRNDVIGSAECLLFQCSMIIIPRNYHSCQPQSFGLFKRKTILNDKSSLSYPQTSTISVHKLSTTYWI